MFGHIVTQKHFTSYSINKMAYDVSLTAPNNKLNVESSEFARFHLVSIFRSVRWRVGYDFDYDVSLCSCEGDGRRQTEIVRM